MTRRRSSIGVAVAIAALGAGMVGLPRVSGEHRIAAPGIGGRSLYQLDSTWTTDAGRTLRLVALQGQVQVLAMIFTSCSAVCPLLVKEIQALDAGLTPASKSQTRFVLVSIDPTRDTPRALRAYRDQMRLAPDRWTLLRGSAGDVRELAAVLGVGYGKTEGADIAHSKLVSVLNRQGEIVHQQAGAAEDAKRIMAAIDHAITEEATPHAR